MSTALDAIRDVASILRIHIIAIAMAAALTFGWILTNEYAVVAMVLGGLDWLLINLLNRVTDLEEDLLNGIRGTERIARRPRLALGVWCGIQLASLILGHLLAPELTPWRLAVQLVGVGYSYRVVPTPGGFKRFKDLYFFKNFMSAMLFVATVFVYPTALHGLSVDTAATLGLASASLPGPHEAIVVTPLAGGWTMLALILFFVPFEITYEILYDMRDLEGDRAAKVPTYPVVHGLEASAQIIDALLVVSGLALITAFATSVIGLRELLMIVAPVIQFTFYRKRFRRGLTTAECIVLTWLGAGLLVFWLVGTRVWLELGLPANVYVTFR